MESNTNTLLKVEFHQFKQTDNCCSCWRPANEPTLNSVSANQNEIGQFDKKLPMTSRNLQEVMPASNVAEEDCDECS